MERFLKTALAAAEAASAETMKYYRGAFEVELKEDQTPVTVADRRAEDIIRDRLLGAFPEHGFFGEETGRTQDDADYLWLVDPIDGTKGFVRQYPFFSTQIALMHNGEIVLGVSSAPMMKELAWAEKGVVNPPPAGRCRHRRPPAVRADDFGPVGALHQCVARAARQRDRTGP